MSNCFPKSGLTLCLILILSSIFGCETDYSFDCEQCEFKDCHNGNVFCFDCFGSRGDLFDSCPNGCENGKCLSNADCSIRCEENNRSCGEFMDCDCGDCSNGLSCVDGSCIKQSGNCHPCEDDIDCSDGDCFLIDQNGSEGRYCLPTGFNQGSSICSYCPDLTSFGCCSSVSDCDDCSSWGSCSYATTCSESGTKLRSCPSCKYQTCSTVSESSACSRNTDGISCGTENVCRDGSCTPSCTPNCNAKCKGESDGCGGKCPQTSCAGCCSGTGCENGYSDDACGKGGEACRVCPTGRSCQSRECALCTPKCSDKCKGEPDGCGGTCPTNKCTGCCSGGTCKLGTNNLNCGSGGVECKTCSDDKRCSAGSCVTSNPPCNSRKDCLNYKDTVCRLETKTCMILNCSQGDNVTCREACLEDLIDCEVIAGYPMTWCTSGTKRCCYPSSSFNAGNCSD